MRELIVAIAASMFMLFANAAESILGEYHADTKSDWGWTLVLTEGFSGKIIFTEFPNECELCESIEMAEQGVWSISENRIALVLSTGKEYIFRIEGEDMLVLVEPSFPEIEPGKFVFRKEI